jgi:hypothetical protein
MWSACYRTESSVWGALDLTVASVLLYSKMLAVERPQAIVMGKPRIVIKRACLTMERRR